MSVLLASQERHYCMKLGGSLVSLLVIATATAIEAWANYPLLLHVQFWKRCILFQASNAVTVARNK